MERKLKHIPTEDKEFLQKLQTVTQFRIYRDLKESDRKQFMKYFMQHAHFYSGPERGEADNTLKAALVKHFQGHSWHFIVKGNIFR